MKYRFAILAGAAALVFSNASNALTFNFTFLPGTTAQAQQGFIDAGMRWSALFSDPVTIDLTVGQQSLGSSTLAAVSLTTSSFSYSNFKSALTSDQVTATDTLAVSNLPGGPSFGMLINRTADNPNGSGSATPYVDSVGANNAMIRMSNANAKALNLSPVLAIVGQCASACDGSIVFNSDTFWDYNPNDGIISSAFDFVGIAAHEIGHTLGFISGVDVLDTNSPPNGSPLAADQLTFVSSLDMFRFSAASIAAGGLGTIDWTANTTAKYFSLDKGATVGASFSTGDIHGDFQQASHWKDGQGLGIMDPTAAPGEALVVGANDEMAFDAIGWNLSPIPEPQTYALFAMGLLGLALRRRALRRD
jgi:hypothetical protein